VALALHEAGVAARNVRGQIVCDKRERRMSFSGLGFSPRSRQPLILHLAISQSILRGRSLY
jgi:hypothetical protein